MNAAPATSAAAAHASHHGNAVMSWVLAAVIGLDYFDNAIFSFFATYIAGGINASPDELVWASSAYALGAVLGILQQHWWVERIGYRRYIAGCMGLYSAGALLAALCDSSAELLFARGIQGYFVGPMLGACRILIQISFTAQRRADALRVFLTLIVLGSALAPIAGAWLVSHFDWRALFACTAPAGFVLGVLALLSLPDTGDVDPAHRTEPHYWAYLVFAFAQAALQIVMTQLRFQLFTGSPGLIVLTVCGIAGLAWFVHHQWHHPAPLVRMHALREPTFQVGLVLYVFYYYLSTGFSYLLPRLMERGLGFTIESTGYFNGVTSLLSGMLLFVYLHYSKHVPRKKWIIVPGFALAALAALWTAQMSPQAGHDALAAPLLLRGLLLLFIVLPVANLTFRVFEIEAFAHGYRLKNLVRQLAISFATASIIMLEQHRLALHETRLVEAANPYNPIFSAALDTLSRSVLATGNPSGDSHGVAIALLARSVAQQANFLASLDGFYFLAAIALVGGLFAAWQRALD
ncbi:MULTISPECIES: MFS transporter [Burkholderiaceae]|uniref:MFS transporter n=1 Tax=Burkholderiaceae TaxID=119060 RepID=UPI00095999AA|nr:MULTISPECIES: MFS transporter [Burkholderiaceae]MCG1018232.1 MFS transporter [Mycetohabitans sp. B4]SIT66926.1 Major Facilitator Superfamily protein [Burkholderia sp. b13]